VFEGKAIVNAQEAVRDIRSGMSDEALMDKYAISRKGLESLFRKLVAAGEIGQSDLDRRGRPLRTPTWVLSLRNPPRPPNVKEEYLKSAEPEAEVSPQEGRSIWEAYRHYFFAVVGAAIGGVSVFLSMTFFDGSGPSRLNRSAALPAPTAAAGEKELTQVEQLIKIFEAITSERMSKVDFGSPAKTSQYKECLDNCARSHKPADHADKALFINCRKECIAQYAERAKEIRRRYYGDAELD
jgi:hypothetical protein